MDDVTTENEDEEFEENELRLEENLNFKVNDFVLVEFHGKVLQYYIGLVKKIDATDGLVRFLRKAKKSFVFLTIDEEVFVEKCQLKRCYRSQKLGEVCTRLGWILAL